MDVRKGRINLELGVRDRARSARIGDVEVERLHPQAREKGTARLPEG